MLLLPCDVPASWRRRCRDSWCVINLKVVLWILGKTSIRLFVLERIWVTLSIFEEQFGRQLLHFWCLVHFFSSPKSQTNNPFLPNGSYIPTPFSQLSFSTFPNCNEWVCVLLVLLYILLMLCDSGVSFVLQNKCSLFVPPHFPGVVTWKVLLFPVLFH